MRPADYVGRGLKWFRGIEVDWDTRGFLPHLRAQCRSTFGLNGSQRGANDLIARAGGAQESQHRTMTMAQFEKPNPAVMQGLRSHKLM